MNASYRRQSARAASAVLKLTLFSCALWTAGCSVDDRNLTEHTDGTTGGDAAPTTGSRDGGGGASAGNGSAGDASKDVRGDSMSSSGTGGALSTSGGGTSSSGSDGGGAGTSSDGGSAGTSSDGGLRDAGPTPQPSLSLMPPLSAFGKVVVGGMSGVTTFMVTNGGDGPSSALGASISGADAGAFKLVGMDCLQKTLQPGGSCTLGVRFDPTQTGMRSAVLNVTGANPTSASLTGEGISPSALGSTPPAGDFDGVPISGTTTYADQLFTIKNTGAQTSGMLTTGIEGTNASAFVIQADGCSQKTLATNDTCTITIRFTPGSRGVKTATLDVQGMPGGLVPVSLTGSGLAPAAFTILPATSTLATAVDVNGVGTETATITVANAGDVSGTPSVSASDSSNFAITDGCTGGAALPAGQTCSVLVKLTPKSYGAKSTTLTVANGVTGMSSAVVNGTGRDSLALAVTTAGNGAGSVSAAYGVEANGIGCPGDCSEHYYRTTSNPIIALSATYDASTTDVSWSAPCAGSTTSCNVTLSTASTAVTVTFTKKRYTLTITRSAETGATGATGTVTGTGIGCGSGGTCSVTVDGGTQVVLTASPGSGYYFSGWTGGGCSGGTLTCTTGAINANTTVDAKFTVPNVVFTTSLTYTVDQYAGHDPMGQGDPIRGADQFCRDRAAAGVAPGLTGRTWTSLLTRDSANFSTRLGTKRGWVRPDGKPFGDDPESYDLGNKVFYPPVLDENGQPIGDGNTATLGSGCKNWTSSAMADYRAGGEPMNGGYGWNNALGEPCIYPAHLYCMSIDYTATVTAPPPTPGRIAFLSDGIFRPGLAGMNGLAGADSLCQSEANAAGYTGTFKAFMGSTNPAATPIGRFSTSGAIWVRPDGIPIVANAADLDSKTPHLIATIQVSPTKRYYGNAGAWTGASDPQTTATAALTCTPATPATAASWTSGDTTVTGRVGSTHYTDNRFIYDYYDPDCTSTYGQLYCLQQ